MLKKATTWIYSWFFEKKIGFAFSKYINTFNIMKKKLVSVYKFRTYFFPPGEVDVSFSNLLSTAKEAAVLRQET